MKFAIAPVSTRMVADAQEPSGDLKVALLGTIHADVDCGDRNFRRLPSINEEIVVDFIETLVIS
jgi:hypothetical protein